ncbi:MAG: hypothetical protein HQ580_10565 [Planctomycetes bacterium]|nr:hypothetical protein [Planctomycetota bacterium]
MSEWEVDKPLGQCCGTGRKIEPGEEYFGALLEIDKELQRRDFCADYWESEKPNVFCYWRSRLPRPDEKKQIFVDDNMLMAFFERLENETEQEKVNFRFVLALILMRKKRLKYDATRDEDRQEIWRLRIVGDKSSERRIEVINPHLDEEQVEKLSSQIGQILQADV